MTQRRSKAPPLPFLVKAENVLAQERHRRKARAKVKKSKANMTEGNDTVAYIIDDNNAFGIFNE